METFVQDLAYGFRILRKSPAFTAVIILTLALGIGANTAIFSILHAVLLRPLPYHDPSRLELIFAAPVHDRETKIFVPYRHFKEWSEKNRSYESMAAETWAHGPRFLLGRGAPQSVLAVPVSLDFFSTLGVRPLLGRAFTREDLSQGCTVVLAHSFWQNRLGGDSSIVGQHLALDDASCAVIGVMPADFVFYPVPSEMWTLITPDSDFERNPDRNGVAVIGRLRAGVSRSAAESELRQLAQAVDQGHGFGVEVEPESFNLQEEFTWLAGRNLRLSVLVLFGAVSLLLLIACVNVANLLLSRLWIRRRELAIRAAIGSGQTRLLRQLLTESLLLCISAAILGVLIAVGAVHFFRIFNPIELPPGALVSVNIPVLAFTLVLALLTTILFGFVPAWRGSKVSVNEALKSSGRGSGEPSRQRLSKLLAAAEMMLSLMSLAGAGLLIRSIASFTSAPLGFVPDRLLTMTVSLPPFSYAKPEQRKTLYDEIEGRIVALPGIEAVGMSSRAAMKGSTGVSTLIVEGRPPADPETVILDTEQQFITDGYFRFMGIGFEQGREFERQDRGDASPVAVVNTALVRKYFPNENPLGRHIRLSETGSWLTIVGVSGDERQSTPFHEMAWAAPPIVYRPLAQQPPSSVDLIVRVGSLQSIQSAVIQQEILKFAPDLRITDVHPMQYFLDKYTSYPRLRAMLMGLFAGMALLLSVIGLYAVLSQLVVQRTQEIGIRMALGAQASDVLRLIMKQGILLVGFGTGAGLMAALGLAHLLRNLLFGVQPEDPLTLSAVTALLILAALAAIYIPARRAARVNPINSLRSE